MTNTTQCPKCSSIFVISDEQYSASKGNVRCGTCREKFSVVFLPNNEELVLNTNTKTQEASNYSSNQNKKQSELLKILSEHAEREQADLIEDDLTKNSSEELEDDIVFNSNLSIEPETSDLFSNSFTEQQSEDHSISFETDTSVTTNQQSLTLTLSDEEVLSHELIDQVDTLIDSKLFNDEPSQVIEPLKSEPFSLTPSWQSRLKHSITLFSSLIVGLLLLFALTYQLWLKQMLPEFLVKPSGAAQEFLEPIINKAANQYGYALPVRRDLNNLQLLSAKTEAHPTRASTILLRVSFLNRSEIEQPLPWLELSLTDENGRLISRRSFEPNDYLYNNATENSISANELKKVTVELLAFPKQAHGYELKMIGK